MRIYLPSFVLFAAGVLCSCQVRPYAPPPQAAFVESVSVESSAFQGRPEVNVFVKGRLSSTVAQLVDAKQYRDGDRLYIDIMEQTPRGAEPLPDLAGAPSFETSQSLEVMGLDFDRPYVLVVNGIESELIIPSPRAEAVGDLAFLRATNSSAATTPPDTMVDLENPYGLPDSEVAPESTNPDHATLRTLSFSR